ncbi:hypothetical protein [Micromonospora sediminicola]|uniref:hypothetical protein n=1 Tax=Micromonospora sediminicola TaxID=946078 RepID=UPI00378B9A0A
MATSNYYVSLTLGISRLTVPFDSSLLDGLYAHLRLLQEGGVLGGFYITGHRASRILRVTVVVEAVRITAAGHRAEIVLREAATGLIDPAALTIERLAVQPAKRGSRVDTTDVVQLNGCGIDR